MNNKNIIMKHAEFKIVGSTNYSLAFKNKNEEYASGYAIEHGLTVVLQKEYLIEIINDLHLLKDFEVTIRSTENDWFTVIFTNKNSCII